MKSRALVFLLILGALPPLFAQQSSDSKKLQLALCPGPFALCAASTCTLTDHKYPGTIFPEVVCKCPVLAGPALADLGGEMKGSCAPPHGGLWSLYSTATSFPQEINGKWRRDIPAHPHNCPASKDGKPLMYGQCFSYPCDNVRLVNKVRIADCHCPGLTVVDPSRHEFATQAGHCHDKACSEIPVGGPFDVPKSMCDE